jgi:GGDEF domain-containing protein
MFKIDDNHQPDNEILKKYRIDSAFGCYTRNALEMEIWPVVKGNIRYVIFADVDEMRVANQKFGYSQTDRKIRKAITAREGDIVVARWYSGDELVFFLLDGPRMGDPIQYAQRIQGRLHQAGLSATFGIVELGPGKKARLAAVVGKAAGLVQKTKAGRVRDCILTETMLLSAAGRRTI